jgi:hypothetical protein
VGFYGGTFAHSPNQLSTRPAFPSPLGKQPESSSFPRRVRLFPPLVLRCSSGPSADCSAPTVLAVSLFGALLPTWSLLIGDRTNDQLASTSFDERRISLGLGGIKQFLKTYRTGFVRKCLTTESEKGIAFNRYGVKRERGSVNWTTSRICRLLRRARRAGAHLASGIEEIPSRQL